MAADVYVPIMTNGKTKDVKIKAYPGETSKFWYEGTQYTIRIAKARGILNPDKNYANKSGLEIRNTLIKDGPYKQKTAENTHYCSCCHRLSPKNEGRYCNSCSRNWSTSSAKGSMKKWCSRGRSDK
ncbi:MAG TPA: hypothetical protein VEL47_00205 [Myxococcota bacterium]|nr:hypothetical protein [Myxococcota bacterium]